LLLSSREKLAYILYWDNNSAEEIEAYVSILICITAWEKCGPEVNTKMLQVVRMLADAFSSY
jgi:hypothetical protein